MQLILEATGKVLRKLQQSAYQIVADHMLDANVLLLSAVMHPIASSQAVLLSHYVQCE
jgi:hypothetical protein